MFISMKNRLEFLLVGIITSAPLFLLAYELALTRQNGEGLGAFIIFCCGAFILRSMVVGAFRGPNTDEPLLIWYYYGPRLYAVEWWDRYCRQFETMNINGFWYYCDLWSHQTWSLYNHEGYFAGMYEAGRDFIRIPDDLPLAIDHSRLGFISRLRSGKLPIGQYAEVLDRNGRCVGYTKVS